MDGMNFYCQEGASVTLSQCSNSEGSSAGSGNNGGEVEGTEETEDSSSSSSAVLLTASGELDNFRQQWQLEIENMPLCALGDVPDNNQNHLSERLLREKQVEEKARDLYLQGVNAERRGHLYDAISFYRRAVQLVPDIEFRVAKLIPKSNKQGNEDPTYDDDDSYEEDYDDDDDETVDNPVNTQSEEIDDLLTRFNRMFGRNGKICQPIYDQKMSHISVLPREILLYICKWVISSDLDLRSLEQLALACRGFYVCARDDELWRLACGRVWGVSCGSPNKYGSWREMYIKRPRLSYNGAYISKTTYIRPGEPAFQDVHYRPWLIVDYYRYLRFFPEGIVLMMTTSDEPVVSLPKLRSRNAKHYTLLAGHYCIHGCQITANLKRTTKNDVQPTSRFSRYRKIQQDDKGEQTFHVEFEVMAYKNRPNYKLEWRSYSVHTVFRNGQESVSEFDLHHNKFPPFWFSRVKSYASFSEKPLQ